MVNIINMTARVAWGTLDLIHSTWQYSPRDQRNIDQTVNEIEPKRPMAKYENAPYI